VIEIMVLMNRFSQSECYLFPPKRPQGGDKALIHALDPISNNTTHNNNNNRKQETPTNAKCCPILQKAQGQNA